MVFLLSTLPLIWYMFPFYPQKSFSHLLIVFCIIIASIGFLVPWLVSHFGMNNYSFLSRDYITLWVQILLFQFLHGGVLHLFMNCYFLYSAWPEVEARMSRDRYIWFFVTATIFVAIALLVFQPYATTIWISWFCMAILSYLWIDLYTTRHPMAPQILMMLAINIGIGLVPGISLVGHLFGAIWWLIWWALFRNWRK